MNKSIYITLAVIIFIVFSTDVFSETIMIQKDDDIHHKTFPDLADYSLHENSFEAINSSNVSIEPAIWPFGGKKDSGSSNIKPKSTRKAFFLSLLLPGLGETYVGSKRAIVFLGLEAFSWWKYLTNTKEGNDLEDKFQRFADRHWHYYDETTSAGDPLDYNYWKWLQHNYEINELTPEDYNEIKEIIEAGGQSHSLPSKNTQQYYEMIGKYDHFVYGWEDIEDNNPSLEELGYGEKTELINSPLRLEYMKMRGDSNDRLKAGQQGIYIMLINRIVSAIDAGRLAYHHNKNLDSDLSMVRIKFVQKHIIDRKVPMIMITKKF